MYKKTLNNMAKKIILVLTLTLSLAFSLNYLFNKIILYPRIKPVSNLVVNSITNRKELIAYSALSSNKANNNVETITIIPASRTINVGSKLSLLPVTTPQNVSDESLTWKSSNPEVATVNSIGVVTGKSGGETTITVISKNGMEATSIITVNSSYEIPVPPSPNPEKPSNSVVKVTKIDISPKSANLEIGEIISIIADITPSNATNTEIKWTSSDEHIATVDRGIVTGKSAGTVTITATTVDGSKKDECHITVNKKEGVSNTGDEPSVYEPSIYESESDINLSILIILLISIVVFIIGAVAYFIVKVRRSNYV